MSLVGLRSDGDESFDALDCEISTLYDPDYDDTLWNEGQDPPGAHGGFGYGDPVAVDLGRPAAGNRNTAYFRHRFRTEVSYEDLLISLQRDDGVIIYLDGKEVARDNMPSGPEAYDLMALRNPGYDERDVVRIGLAGSLLPGEHVLAISLHNNSSFSSDLRLAEITLRGRRTDDPPNPLTDPAAVIDRNRAYEEWGWNKP